MNTTVDVSGLLRARRRLQRRAKQVAAERARAVLDRVATEARPRLPVRTGELRDSINVVVSEEGATIEAAPYAKTVGGGLYWQQLIVAPATERGRAALRELRRDLARVVEGR